LSSPRVTEVTMDQCFSTPFDCQNEMIRRGALEGEIITVSALMLNNYLSFARHPP
ncbi:hypothetical protein FRB95_003525, partial [Tulasnella sp. JGI-2019a]